MRSTVNNRAGPATLQPPWDRDAISRCFVSLDQLVTPAHSSALTRSLRSLLHHAHAACLCNTRCACTRASKQSRGGCPYPNTLLSANTRRFPRPPEPHPPACPHTHTHVHILDTATASAPPLPQGNASIHRASVTVTSLHNKLPRTAADAARGRIRLITSRGVTAHRSCVESAVVIWLSEPELEVSWCWSFRIFWCCWRNCRGVAQLLGSAPSVT